MNLWWQASKQEERAHFMNRGYKSRTIEVIIIIEATKRAMDMRGGEQKQRRC